jgi:hypothetical protein
MSGCEERRWRGSSGLDPRERDGETQQTQRPAAKSASHPPPRPNRAHTSPRPVAGEDVRPATSACGGGGRAGSARRWSSVTTFATVLGRFPETSGRNPGGGGIGERGRRGLKSPARSGRGRRPSARRGPPSERVKNPRSEGFWKTAARSARDVSKRYSPNLYTGRAPDAPPPPQPAGFPDGDMRSRVSPRLSVRRLGTRPRACPRSDLTKKQPRPRGRGC